ncbi:TetR/AcrR family transcriptional regulator [Facklamia miroungae]|uniref:DNA-binding transcriptional regulator, AcrR family n=1 Tax=Facklamia miroungae TaxID=120956 RepID=A0A1G7QD09_9LACT|nr:TetR/AcrR family transcriptional regulator [Facklamia miroungae]NKZ28887.1 TetR/AcrR family transcriptional regulator [Facklamia miroungae]SDF95799.1 DNA-binding transcriptional regulator, AcrR family [Facklamia miroungae]
MCSAKRLKPEERKNEIKKAAAKVFVGKGFSKTTMEDVINETTMSKGGVYHYYASTLDILHDLMVDGIHYRNEVIQSNLSDFKKGYEIKFIAKQIVDKILDDNFYMDIYVQFLIEKKRNEKLNKLFEVLKEQSRQEFLILENKNQQYLMDDNMYDLVTNFINSMIIGAEILDARENLKINRNILERMAIILIEEGGNKNGKNNEREALKR